MSQTEGKTEKVASSPDEIRVAVLEGAREGRLACAVAHRIAENLDVPVRVVGDVAQEEGLKIALCELGCF